MCTHQHNYTYTILFLLLISSSISAALSFLESSHLASTVAKRAKKGPVHGRIETITVKSHARCEQALRAYTHTPKQKSEICRSARRLAPISSSSSHPLMGRCGGPYRHVLLTAQCARCLRCGHHVGAIQFFPAKKEESPLDFSVAQGEEIGTRRGRRIPIVRAI